MKKLLKILLHIIPSVLMIVLAYLVLEHWIVTGAKATQAAFLYVAPAAGALHYEETAQNLATKGLQTTCTEVTDLTASAGSALQQGASILVVGLDAAPADTTLLQQAQKNNAVLFFVGSYPGDDYLAGYDKAYYIGMREEYAGELAGTEIAGAVKNGAIADRNENLLLEYLSTDENAVMSTYAITECEHYGIYTKNGVPQPAEDPNAEAPQENCPDLTGLSADAILLADLWMHCTDIPEVILCMGAAQTAAAQEYAAYAGWENVSFAAFAPDKTSAEALEKSGCATVVYSDIDTVSNTISTMILNMVHQASITDKLDVAPDIFGALWLPYQLQCTAADDLPATAPVPTETPVS